MAAYFSSVMVFFLIYLFSFSLVEAVDNGGFSVDFIQRDSLLSPSYDPSVTRFERQQNAFRRSVSRANHLQQSLTIFPSQVSTPVAHSGGAYLMKISFGTPPVENLAIADTGSDLIWIQCKPCEQCYNQTAPLFDPSKSSTYRDLSCKSKQCDLLGTGAGGCSAQNNSCEYSYSYGDQSFTNGLLATETFRFGSNKGRRPIALPKKIFGCGHNNDGTFNEEDAGLVGLGRGPLSLISQLKSSILGKFSYCLVPFDKENVTSKLNFGRQAEVSGNDVVSTPLVSKHPVTFYYVTLEAISVGNKRFAYKTKNSSLKEAVDAVDEGNIILDSGTTLTFLDTCIYQNLKSEVKKAISGKNVADPDWIFRLCYNVNTDINVSITAHFAGGADLKLKPLNTFVQISEELVCFAFLPNNNFGVFGNIAQSDFLVSHDIVKRKVYFKPTDCTKN